MNNTNTPTFIDDFLKDTHFGGAWKATSAAEHICIIIGLAFLVHLIVKLIRHISEWFINKSHAKKNPFGFVTQQPKFVTLTRLIISAVTFVIYSFAIFLVLIVAHPTGTENILKTYLTSAAVIGLGLSFGLQGLVQDLVTGVTLIFSSAMDVGDLVDLGPIGRVEQIGLRFTKLVNFYNQEVFVPNRNIGNVARFPYGGIFAHADVQIPALADQQKAAELIERVSRGMWSQFGAIILNEPGFEKMEATAGGWNFIRVHFKIWPGQGSLIETTFRSQMVAAMKAFDANYADWQVAVTYRAMSAPAKAA
jgi:moderate conductance mechanosensitive channel